MLLLGLIFFSITLCAQLRSAADSSVVAERHFNVEEIVNLKKNKNFQYETQAMEPPSLWDRFWAWIWEKYDEIMKTEAGRITLKTIFWILLLLAVALFFYKVVQMNRASLFSRDPGKINYTVEQENIHEIDFDRSLAEAVAAQNYRIAVRLWYLQLLKILSDKKLIEWQINKTNRTYINELKDTSLVQAFKKITALFEAVWYGNKDIDEKDFEEINAQFQTFKNSI